MVKLTESIVCSRTKVSALENVRKLNCWGCDLDDIEICQQMPNLEVLSLSVNNIASLWPLAGCTKIRELYLRKNNIADLRELRHLRHLSDLRILWVSENPCVEHPDYRHYILSVLPALTTLDNQAVTPDELNAMGAYDQANGGCNEDSPLATQVEEVSAYSSPECDQPTPVEMVNVNNGIGWKTVRLPDRPPTIAGGNRRAIEMERPQTNNENFAAMSVSCYVPNVVADGNGYNIRANERRNTSTSMTSVYETTPEVISWQQPRRGSTQRQSISTPPQNNVLIAVEALLNELDKQGLQYVINKAEQRLRRL